MHPFLETISVAGGIVAPLVLAIMVLTLFYRALGWLSRGATPNTIAVHGVLKKTPSPQFMSQVTNPSIQFASSASHKTAPQPKPISPGNSVVWLS